MCMNQIVLKYVERYGITVITSIMLVFLYINSEKRAAATQASLIVQMAKSQNDVMQKWEKTLELSEARSMAQIKLVSACCQSRKLRDDE